MDCCSNHDTPSPRPERHRCPVNGREYRPVPVNTLLHHLAAPWNRDLGDQNYYFCEDPDCDVVYFGRDDAVIRKAELRTTVGIKEAADTALVCYCFGVTRRDALMNPATRAFVREKTRERVCACAARNPSGRCCLGDFP